MRSKYKNTCSVCLQMQNVYAYSACRYKLYVVGMPINKQDYCQ
jgi:hypothetical protein